MSKQRITKMSNETEQTTIESAMKLWNQTKEKVISTIKKTWPNPVYEIEGVEHKYKIITMIRPYNHCKFGIRLLEWDGLCDYQLQFIGEKGKFKTSLALLISRLRPWELKFMTCDFCRVGIDETGWFKYLETNLKKIHLPQPQPQLQTTQDFKEVYKTKQDSDDIEDGKMCVVCFENIKSIAIVPCGHADFCEKCMEKIEKCPSCRGNIQIKLRIFQS